MASCNREVLIVKKLFRIVRQGAQGSHADRAVVFVHGFLGDSVNTWSVPGAAESFPDLLASDPRLADHDVFLFHYVTKDLRPPAIDNIVVQLRFAIKEYLQRARIIFLAHSMGGLVSMRCILSLLEDGQSESVGGLLMYGTPMSGIEWSKYARLVLSLGGIKFPGLSLLSRWLESNKQLEALTAGSDFIERLNSKWVLRALNGGHPKVPAEQRAWFPVRVVSGNDDWVVRESSARGFYSDIDWLNVDQDHRALVKPSDRSEFTYQIARNFLEECRKWMNPPALLKLRHQLDNIWTLHEAKHIANWRFELAFAPEDPPPTSGGFGLPEFYSFSVLNCSYRRRIDQPFLKFGFAIGHIAEGAIWTDEFAFMHSLRFGALSVADSEAIRERLLDVLASGDAGWNRLFDGVSLRVRGAGQTTWFQLLAGPLELVNDGLVRPFLLPPEAYGLVGTEAEIDVAFRGLLPDAISDYTMEFPWLSDGFTVRVTVKGKPSYLISSQAMRGRVTCKSKREQQGKLELSSEDLILPGSYIRFEWDSEKREAK